MLLQRPGLKRGTRELVHSGTETATGNEMPENLRFLPAGRVTAAAQFGRNRNKIRALLSDTPRTSLDLRGKSPAPGGLAAHRRENRMRGVRVLGLALLGLFSALPAQALTITNTDPDPRTVTVKAGSDKNALTIEPGKSAEPQCKPCTIELENGELYEMEGGENLVIEDGVIFADGVGSNASPAQ